MYPLLAMEPALKLWKQHYCEKNFEKCARFNLSLEGNAVPLTLLPNGKQLAPRSKEEINASALFNAIEKGRIPVIRSMMKTGIASMSLKTSDGLSPLMVAASVGNIELVQLMLEHGCNPGLESNHGLTATSLAKKNGHKKCVQLLRKAELNTSAEDFVQYDNTESAEDEASSVIRFLHKMNPFK
jgi:hypothetical protein